MKTAPDIDDFSTTFGKGKPQVVWTSLIADLETPVSAMLKLGADRPYSFLLESVEGGAVRGRYSIIGLDPDIIWRVVEDKVEINTSATTDLNRFEPRDEAPLEGLRSLLAQSRIDLSPELPPMASGIFGYLDYDMVRQMEELPDANPDVFGLPQSIFIRPTIMAVFDAVKDEIIVLTPVWPNGGVTATQAYDLACARLSGILDKLAAPLDYATANYSGESSSDVAPVSNMSKQAYMDKVERAKEYIAAGDIFQVVLSQRFEIPFTLPSFALYRALRRVNPSPFLFYLNFGGFAIIGSSPEILVRVREGTVTIRPIAGTRRRGHNPADDRAMANELINDPKELAEHLMLLDLGRNDVGRVAKIGSINVTDKFSLEYYSHVMHISSNVEGELDEKHDAISALVAGFPAGTVSGAPKVRAMEIIDELEEERRGIYAGCVGYFSANGDMDTCIALRTTIIKDGKMYIQAGAGVVADSIPELEHKECCNKARAAITAAEEAVRFSSSHKIKSN